MTPDEIIGHALQEATERATRAVDDAIDACETFGEPLTKHQRVFLHSSLLNQFMGLEECVSNVVSCGEVLEDFADCEMTPLADEVEAWLARFKGREQ